MSGLLIFYRLVGVALLALTVLMLAEKYRTVRGGLLCDARILRCEKAVGTAQNQASGGWCYRVELYHDGARRECLTNDSFWFEHPRHEGQLIQIWYKPGAPLVERKSFGTELLAAATAAIGIFFLVL